MDIKGTMRKYGYTMQQLADKIDGSQSSLSQVMSNPYPTLRMLDKIADGLGCKRWEFFLDEMDPEEVMAKLGMGGIVRHDGPTLAETLGDKADDTIERQQKSAADELPFKNDGKEGEQQAEQVRAVRFTYGCPHCGHQVTVTIE